MVIRNRGGLAGRALVFGTCIGCVDVASGEDCLTLTELSAARPGPLAFDPNTCEILPTTPCNPDDGFGYCPDWIELCNLSDRLVTDTSAYRVTNHRGTDDPNPWHTPPHKLPKRAIPVGACEVFPLEIDDDNPTPCMDELLQSGLEMETGGFAYVDAKIGGREVCRASVSYPGWIPTRASEEPTPSLHFQPGSTEGFLDLPTPGEPW